MAPPPGAVRTSAGSTSRRSLSLALVLALAASLLVTLAPAAHAAPHAQAEQRFVEMVNAERTSRGLPALASRQDVRDVAYSWSATMAAERKLYHNPSFSTQITCWSRVTENVAYATGYGDWEDNLTVIHEGLMKSLGHRANILDPGVDDIGVGVHWDGTWMWVTQNFRKPTSCAPSDTTETVSEPPDAGLPHACPVGAYRHGTFADVDAGSGHGPAIDCMAAWGIVGGTGDGMYRPQRDLTRAQAATLIANVVLVAGGTLPPATDQGFTDVGDGPHAAAINRLAAAGIIGGTSPTTFNPDGSLGRGQMAKMLVEAFEHVTETSLPNGATGFSDIAGTTHAVSIEKAATAGFANGVTDTTFAPGRTVTRAQMASFLARVVDRLVEDGVTPGL